MKQIIMKRIEPDDFSKILLPSGNVEAEGTAGFDAPTIDIPATRAKLRLAFEDNRRSHQNLSDAYNGGLAWRSLSDEERRALLIADDTGEDPTFDRGKVDVEKLATFLLEARSDLISKSHPGLSREQSFAAAVEQHPDLFKISRDARRAQLASGPK